MSHRQKRDRQPILTLEPMYLMSASALDVSFDTDPNSEIDPGVGPLPGLDFPGELIVDPDELNEDGTNNDWLFFADQVTSESAEISGAIPIPANSTASLVFLGEGAGYQNTVGTYLIDEKTGEISDVTIAFEDASARGSGGDLVKGDSVEVSVEQGKQVGFFILANGNRRNDLTAVADSELSFVERSNGVHQLVAEQPNGRLVRLNGPLYLSDASMNPAGLNHFRFESTESGIEVRIEDLPQLGDRDYDDVILSLSIQNQEPEVVIPEFASLGGSVTYVERADAVVLDADAAMNDMPVGRLDGAVLSVRRAGGISVDDVFSSTGTLGGLDEGSDLTVDGKTVGHVTTNSQGALELTFNADADTEAVNAVLQQIAYSNSADYISGDVHMSWNLTTADNMAAEGSSAVRLIDSDRIYVTTAEREVDGDTSSIAALIASSGGTGISLEEAIIAANNTENFDGADEIFFNIAGDGVHVIEGAGQPDITDAVTIDASTETDFVDQPRIVLDGNDAAGNGFTITSTANGTEIRGFNIRDFGGNGIAILAGSDDNVIANNWIGRLANDGSDAGADEQNQGAGIFIAGASNYIGGMTSSEANVISGNYKQGIRVSGEAADYNVIHGNLIGTDLDGSVDIGNRWAGIRVDRGADDTVIGGTEAGAGNILSGNGTYGIRVNGAGTIDTTIQGNLIGTDHSGTVAMGNDINGILVDNGAQGTTIGGSDDGAGNVISANGRQGVRVSGAGTDFTVIQGNVIGTNADGTEALGNVYAGILIDSGARDTVVGGDFEGAANIVSGNGTHGVRVTGEGTDDSTIQGNLIGTDESGSEAIGNSANGVRIDSGATGTTIGGSTDLAGNVVSGNGTQGVRISGSGTDNSVVQGNVIGTDSIGVFALGNRYAGVLIDAGAQGSVIGGGHFGAENIISGNGTHGVRITGAGTNDHTVQGNLIGTDHRASVAVGNAKVGVKIDGGAQGNTIGGPGGDDGNVIATNGLEDIQISAEGTDNNVVQGNYTEADMHTEPVPGDGEQDNDMAVSEDAEQQSAGDEVSNDDLLSEVVAALNEQLPEGLEVLNAELVSGVQSGPSVTPVDSVIVTVGIPELSGIGDFTFVVQSSADGSLEGLPIDIADFIVTDSLGGIPVFDGQVVAFSTADSVGTNNDRRKESVN